MKRPTSAAAMCTPPKQAKQDAPQEYLCLVCGGNVNRGGREFYVKRHWTSKHMEQPFKVFKKLVVPSNHEDARRYLAEKNEERAKINKPVTSKPITIPSTTSTMQTLEAISPSMSTAPYTIATSSMQKSIEGFLETTDTPDKDNIQAGINQILLTLQDIQLNPNMRKSKQPTTSASIAELKSSTSLHSITLDEIKIEYLDGCCKISCCCCSNCLLYTSPSPRDGLLSRMPSSA